MEKIIFYSTGYRFVRQQSISESLYVNYKNITAIAEKALYEELLIYYKESENTLL
jgi:hypothetical protein